MRLSRFVVVIIGICGAWTTSVVRADGDFSWSSQQVTESVIVPAVNTQTVTVTEDISIAADRNSDHAALSSLCFVCTSSQPSQIPWQHAFVWQVRDYSLSPDPLTISYRPPEQLTLSFDLNRPLMTSEPLPQWAMQQQLISANPTLGAVGPVPAANLTTGATSGMAVLAQIR